MSEELTEICNLRGVLQHMEGETDGRKAGVWSWLEELGIEIQINVFQLDQRLDFLPVYALLVPSSCLSICRRTTLMQHT